MVKNDNPHVIRFYESMKKHNKEKDAINFIEKYQLSKSADINKKFLWAKNLCEFMSENYDDETGKRIRVDCACGPELGKGKKIKDIYEKETDMKIFVEKVNKLNQGFTIEYDGKSFYLIYPQCYCSCVKRINETLPKIWCYCTLGYTKKMFQYIFNKEVMVELLNSVKQGDIYCKIKIILSE